MSDIKINQNDLIDFPYSNAKTKKFILTTTNGVNPTIRDITFNCDIDLVYGWSYLPNAEIGDDITVEARPGTVTALSQNETSGSTLLHVTSAEIFKVEFFIEIANDPTQYEITDVDQLNNTITVSTGINNDKNAGDAIKLVVKVLENEPIIPSYKQIFGEYSLGSKGLVKGYVLRFKYLHKTTPTVVVEITFALRYYY